MLGSREPGKNLTKKVLKCILWVSIKIILKWYWWLMCFDCFVFFYQCLNVIFIISFLILYFNFYVLLFVCLFVCFFLLMNFRKVCTCPCGRYVKENKCWWHALQNVTKKNICAFCIKLFGLCLVFIWLDVFTCYFYRIKFHFIGN